MWQNNRILDDDLLKILNPYLERKDGKKQIKDRFLESAKKYKDRVVQWDKFINYSDSYINILDIDLTNFNIFNNINPNEINNFNKKTNFLIVNPKFNINEDNNKLLKVYKPYLLKKYYLTNKPQIDFDTNKINITIHIRRVPVQSRMARIMNVDDSKYLDLINSINKLKIDNISINILTLNTGNFIKEKYLDLPNVKLYLREYDQNTHLLDFHNMVCSDILIIGCSSYSSLAAYYNNKGIIYYNFGKRSNLRYYFKLDRKNVNSSNLKAVEDKLKNDIESIKIKKN